MQRGWALPARAWPSRTLIERVRLPAPNQTSNGTTEYGGFPEWPKGTDCKSAGYAFGGSNPPSPTKTKNTIRRDGVFCFGMGIWMVRFEQSECNMPVAYCFDQCKHWSIPWFSFALSERKCRSNPPSPTSTCGLNDCNPKFSLNFHGCKTPTWWIRADGRKHLRVGFTGFSAETGLFVQNKKEL